MSVRDFICGALTSGALFLLASVVAFTLFWPSSSPRCQVSSDCNQARRDEMEQAKIEPTPAVILLWTELNGSFDNWVDYFGNDLDNINHCGFESDQIPPRISRNPEDQPNAQVVIFNLNDLRLDDYEDQDTWKVDNLPLLQKNPSQIWALLWHEPPSRIKVPRHKLAWLDELFNWTISYRRDSDIFFPFGYFVDIPYTKVLKTPWRELWVRKGVVWQSDECQTNSKAKKFIDNLAQYNHRNFNVKMLGACSKNGDKLEEPAKFWAALETDICDDYVTEGFFKALYNDYVPVVFGGADIGYDEVALPGTYIDALSFSSPETLADYLKMISKDSREFGQYVAWQHNFQVISGRFWVCPFSQAVIEAAEEKKPPKPVLKNFTQFWDQKRCYGDYEDALLYSMRASVDQ
ncbi:hypothetical protein TCAL_08579 [Tigriopus californicus]|uniref:Fucosyltransferase n=1 Tax=Tigriopus californicus TaxID=6832 RepID=A0A553PCD7_TIGCA|nr:alpha-(1,3)-fucosyltransferase C-like [Tigriopus californicus]TRY75351.1 hypothetical protein TCAL_08579 [Tigriopus californicus]|eukprot:TCALIF_08579-PA protein Name:"Similar to FucTC Alpha-(1,3)-fucosyltransferase C (Drosophila melanogaster)" AED:0.02 eAED:0.02 QI:0/-1/0/1/-1/1/1/0/404